MSLYGQNAPSRRDCHFKGNCSGVWPRPRPSSVTLNLTQWHSLSVIFEYCLWNRRCTVRVKCCQYACGIRYLICVSRTADWTRGVSPQEQYIPICGPSGYVDWIRVFFLSYATKNACSAFLFQTLKFYGILERNGLLQQYVSCNNVETQMKLKKCHWRYWRHFKSLIFGQAVGQWEDAISTVYGHLFLSDH